MDYRKLIKLYKKNKSKQLKGKVFKRQWFSALCTRCGFKIENEMTLTRCPHCGITLITK